MTATAATGVLANDTGSEPKTAGGASDPPHGVVTVSVDGSFTYTPDAGFFGTDTFTYEAANAAGTDTATVTITVNEVLPPAVPPATADDTYATVENTSLSATVATGVLANDTGTSPLTAGSVADPPDGTLDAERRRVVHVHAGCGLHGHRHLHLRRGQRRRDRHGDGDDHRQPGAAGGARADSGRRQLQHRPGHASAATAATGVLANDSDPDGDRLSLRVRCR